MWPNTTVGPWGSILSCTRNSEDSQRRPFPTKVLKDTVFTSGTPRSILHGNKTGDLRR